MKKILCVVFVATIFIACGESAHNSVAKDTTLGAANYVDTILLKRGRFESELISNGNLRARQKSNLRFMGEGYVVELNVGNGQVVNRGQVIARLNDDDVTLLSLMCSGFSNIEMTVFFNYNNEKISTPNAADWLPKWVSKLRSKHTLHQQSSI